MGVILAAGKGTRMHPFSTHFPKPILPVLGKPLLVYQIEMLAAVGVRDVVVVIGHLGHEVVAALGYGERYGVQIQYVEQEETLGIAHAVSRLERYVDRPFFLFLGDIFFEFQSGADLQSMVALFESDRQVSGVLAVRHEPDRDAIKRNFIVISQAGRVTRVIEKPRHPQVDVKGCGIYLFANAFFDSVRRTPRTAMRDEYEITDSIQIFIDDGYRVEAADVVQRDLNVSYPKDLLELNLHVLADSGRTNHIADGAVVHPGAELERCVVMAGAEVQGPIKMRECLVFPGVCLDGDEDLQQMILTPDTAIHCPDLRTIR
jgi:dTDP-glucose pyrophosphorylase